MIEAMSLHFSAAAIISARASRLLIVFALALILMALRVQYPGDLLLTPLIASHPQ